MSDFPPPPPPGVPQQPSQPMSQPGGQPMPPMPPQQGMQHQHLMGSSTAQPMGAAPGGSKVGFTADPSTLAATGLLAAVLFAVVAGLFAFLADPDPGGFRTRLLGLTDTVDVGDVALLGIAVALLLLTPDPPGGINRSLLLQLTAGLAGIITIYSVIRALVVLSGDGPFLLRFAGFVATIGIGIASATIGFYAAKESFLKKEGRI